MRKQLMEIGQRRIFQAKDDIEGAGLESAQRLHDLALHEFVTPRFDAEFFENRLAGLNRLAPTFNTDKMFRAGFKRRKTPAAAAALDVKNPRTPNNVEITANDRLVAEPQPLAGAGSRFGVRISQLIEAVEEMQWRLFGALAV